MERPYDNQLSKLSKNQLTILKYLLMQGEKVVSTREIATRTGVIEKRLGGVLSAMSRKRIAEMTLIEPMGRDGRGGLRWKLNGKALTTVLALRQVKVLLASF